MEHKPLRELGAIADLNPFASVKPLTRRERLARWAEALEREPGRLLHSLHEVEWCGAADRRAMRADDSPLAIAFSDPVLREEGLAGDRYGDAIDFFELSESEAHRVVCSCFYGGTMPAKDVAARIRAMLRPSLAFAATWSVAAMFAGAPVLLSLLR